MPRWWYCVWEGRCMLLFNHPWRYSNPSLFVVCCFVYGMRRFIAPQTVVTLYLTCLSFDLIISASDFDWCYIESMSESFFFNRSTWKTQFMIRQCLFERVCVCLFVCVWVCLCVWLCVRACVFGTHACGGYWNVIMSKLQQSQPSNDMRCVWIVFACWFWHWTWEIRGKTNKWTNKWNHRVAKEAFISFIYCLSIIWFSMGYHHCQKQPRNVN